MTLWGSCEKWEATIVSKFTIFVGDFGRNNYASDFYETDFGKDLIKNTMNIPLLKQYALNT